MRVHFVLDDDGDEDLIRWWLSIPKGQRTENIRRILRWYVVPGGFGELVAAVQGQTPDRAAPVPQPPPPDFGAALDAQMAKFGWDDDT